MRIRVLLADDHPIVRRGLRDVLDQLPDVELVGEAADGTEAVRQTERLSPDVLVLDLILPELDGWQVASQVGRRSPHTRVVVLSMFGDEAYVVKALRAGARAYVLKESAVEDLVRAIRGVMAGKRYFSAPISEASLAGYRDQEEGAPPDPYHTLTTRERQVVRLTAEGSTGAEVAERLFISPRTVETHRANAMRKLGVRNLKELVRLVVERGLVPRRAEGGEATYPENP